MTVDSFEEDLAAAVGFLIPAGHSLEAIRKYTLIQLNGFYQLAVKAAKNKTANTAIMVRMSQSTDQDTWTRYITELTD